MMLESKQCWCAGSSTQERGRERQHEPCLHLCCVGALQHIIADEQQKGTAVCAGECFRPEICAELCLANLLK